MKRRWSQARRRKKQAIIFGVSVPREVLMKIEVYSNADAIAQKTAALVAAEARAALAACDGHEWRAHCLADACSRRCGRGPQDQRCRCCAHRTLPGRTANEADLSDSQAFPPVLWLVTASEKAEMLPRLRFGDAQIPAGRVRADHALALADRTAAGRLDNYSEAGVA
jgi:hypothetical protein